MYTDQQYRELYNLNEYQIKAIKKRMSLDFDKELSKKSEEKAIFSKSFRNNIDVFIQDFLEKGVKFYALTFNLPDFGSQKWEVVHRRLEELILYSMKNIEMIEFMYLSIEKHKENKLKNIPYINCVMGVRSFMGGNILSSIREVYNPFNDNTKVEFLESFNDVKIYWNSIVKENNFNFHRFVRFSKFFDLVYGGLSELEVTWGPEECYDLGYYEGALFSDIKGVEGFNKDNIVICLNLLNVYFVEKGFFLNNNEIYIKISKSKNSFRKVSSIEWLDKKNIEIFNELKEKYYQQLKYFKIDHFLINFWDITFEILKKKNHYLPYLEFTDAVELNNGLFFYKTNDFVSFTEYYNTINTTLYFNSDFCTLNSIWLNTIGLQVDKNIFVEILEKNNSKILGAKNIESKLIK